MSLCFRVAACLSLLSSITYCRAQPSAPAPLRLTLEECIERALSRDPRIAVAGSAVRVRESALAQANAARFQPQMDFSFMSGPVPAAHGGPIDASLRNDFGQLGAFTRFELTALQPLYTFGKVEGKTDAARHAVEAARQEREQAANEVRRDVRRLYYGLLLARELDALTADGLEKIAEARKKVRESLEQGTGQFTPIDEYRLETVSAEVEARRIQSAAGEQAALAALKAATGVEDSADFDVAGTRLQAPDRQVVDGGAAARNALTSRPEMRQLRAGSEAMAALVRSARGDLYPQIFAGGLLRYGLAPNRTNQRNPFVRDDFNFLQGGIAVGFRYSLSLGATRAGIAEADGEREELRARQRAAEVAIGLQARNAARALEAARQTTDTREKAAAVGRRWLAAAQSDFDLGLGETRDLVDAFQAYLQSRAALLESIHNEQIARAELDYAQGGK